jgi:hypothetical protein
MNFLGVLDLPPPVQLLMPHDARDAGRLAVISTAAALPPAERPLGRDVAQTSNAVLYVSIASSVRAQPVRAWAPI